jgi:hypothetical protein
MADKSGRKPPELNRASRHNVSSPVGDPGQGRERWRWSQAQQVCINLLRPVARPESPAFRVSRVAPDIRPFHTLAPVPAFFGIPAHPLALSLGVNESSLLRVLQVARRLVARGWAQRVAWCDAEGRSTPGDMGPAVHFSLVGAIRTAAAGELVGEYALKAVRTVLGEWDLNQWNDNPIRTRRQVVDLLDTCVQRAGGKPPRRGGWVLGARGAG